MSDEKRTGWSPVHGAVTLVEGKRYDDPQEEQFWYIEESGEGVRVNLVMDYSDFFSGRVYGAHPNKLMYAEEADRAIREGYAVEEPVYKVKVLRDFDDDWLTLQGNYSRKPKPRSRGEVMYCTKQRMDELVGKGLVFDMAKPDEYEIASL